MTVQITQDDVALVRRIVRRHYGHFPHLHPDLESAGNLGLEKAARTYTPDRGTSFHTYAWRCMRWAMQDAMRENDHLTRGDRKRATSGDLDDLGHPLSLDLQEDRPDPVDVYDQRITAEAVHQAIDQLPDREAFVVRFCDLHENPQTDAAEFLGVSPTRIGQLRRRAHSRLRTLLGPVVIDT